jgi:hypothetical protein
MEKVNGKLLPHGWMEETEPEGDWFPAETLWVAAGSPSDTNMV